MAPSDEFGPGDAGLGIVLQMKAVAHQVCMAPGGDVTKGGDGTEKILTISRERLEPEAVDAGDEEVARFLQLGGGEPNDGVFLVEFDLLRRKAESKM